MDLPVTSRVDCHHNISICRYLDGWRPLKRTRILADAFPSTDVLGYCLACLRHWG